MKTSCGKAAGKAPGQAPGQAPILAALVIASTMLVSGCAGTPSQTTGYYPSQASQAETGYGTVASIQVIRNASGASGIGAVGGGVVGALLGNQIGSGSGRTAATLAGALGGAVVGNEVERNRAPGRDLYQVGVRLDNGDYHNVTMDSVNDLRIGDRVRVTGERAYRY